MGASGYITWRPRTDSRSVSVPVRVGLVPGPGGRDDGVEVAAARRPAERPGDLRDVGDEARRVAGAALVDAAADLETALDLLARSGAIDETRAEALDWAATAKGALRPLPEHPIKDMLADLSDYVVARIA